MRRQLTSGSIASEGWSRVCTLMQLTLQRWHPRGVRTIRSRIRCFHESRSRSSHSKSASSSKRSLVNVARKNTTKPSAQTCSRCSLKTQEKSSVARSSRGWSSKIWSRWSWLFSLIGHLITPRPFERLSTSAYGQKTSTWTCLASLTAQTWLSTGSKTTNKKSSTLVEFTWFSSFASNLNSEKKTSLSCRMNGYSKLTLCSLNLTWAAFGTIRGLRNAWNSCSAK